MKTCYQRFKKLELKKRTLKALTDAAATLTAAQLIDNGIFTITPTQARALTTDTAANIIAKLPNVEIGTTFEFTVVCLAAFAVTLTAGDGVTVVGSAVANNSSATFVAVIDSATTVKIYRK